MSTTPTETKVTRGPAKVAKGVKRSARLGGTTAQPAKSTKAAKPNGNAKPKARTKRTPPPTRALPDFTNDMVIDVKKAKEANGPMAERVKLLKKGQTVAEALEALKAQGYRRRRASLRKLRKAGVITIG